MFKIYAFLVLAILSFIAFAVVAFLELGRKKRELKNIEVAHKIGVYDYRKLNWHSDWNGYEVGYDDVPVVGLYSIADFPSVFIYVDTETGEILEAWSENERE